MTDISNEDLEIHRPDDNDTALQQSLPGASANNGEDGSLPTTRKRRGRSDASQEDQEEGEESTKRFKKSEDTGIAGEAPMTSSQPAPENTAMPSPVSRKKIDDERRWRGKSIGFQSFFRVWQDLFILNKNFDNNCIARLR